MRVDGPGGRLTVRARLAAAWGRWKAIAHVIGTFQARLLLTLFYFVVVPPFALVVKLFTDPLGLRPPPGASYWTARRSREPGDGADGRPDGRRQF